VCETAPGRYATGLTIGGPLVRVISVSRRTDIPALYAPWFMNRVRAGYCHWVNPFGGQVYRVSLEPQDLVAAVFWTRHSGPLHKHLAELENRKLSSYFHFTITGYPRWLEPHAPRVESALESFRELSRRLGPSRVIWRYDPIILSDKTPVDYHRRRFSELAAELKGFTSSCYFSFATFYGKTQRNLAKAAQAEGAIIVQPQPSEMGLLARELADIAASNGMTLKVCSCDSLVGDGVERGSCIDAGILQRLRPDLDLGMKAAPTRDDCGCCEATDIGAFDTCTFGCSYCYANASHRAALGRRGQHDPKDSLLWRPSTLAGVDLESVARPQSKPKSRIQPRGLFDGDVGR